MTDLMANSESIPDISGVALSADHVDAEAEATQFITFSVGVEEFGVDIVTVQEIKGWTETTALPNAPSYMLGVLNLRGVIVPIYDLRARFGLGDTIPSKSHVIVIVMVSDRIIGILVDAVSDILTVRATKIRAVPEMGGQVDQRFISGLVTVEKRTVALLEPRLLFDIDPAPDEANELATDEIN